MSSDLFGYPSPAAGGGRITSTRYFLIIQHFLVGVIKGKPYFNIKTTKRKDPCADRTGVFDINIIRWKL
ncbi:MAG: hypothetical protein E7494_09765 [Ruminococcus albus]|nr:hypothetical protein [Ruminococcus albus]